MLETITIFPLGKKLCKEKILFIIAFVLLHPHLALTEVGDSTDQNLACSEQLISIPSLNTAKNVIIDTSKARFRKEYSPSQIEDLQRQLESLSTIKFQNGMTRFMLTLVLRTSKGQLDLLRSHLVTSMIHSFSIFDDEVKTERLEAKYSFYYLFKSGTLLGGTFADSDRDRRRALVKIRLVIMEAFQILF